MKRDVSSKGPKALIRLENTRKPRRLLIVCEGEKTEPNYFRGFPNNPKVYDRIKVYGTGHNTVSLVKKAIKLKKDALEKNERYIEIWCVFDKDDFSIEQFNKAIELAKQNNIECAYSIEAFELWYMLHFNFYDSALSREQYKEKLTGLLGKTYKKNDTGMYELLEDKQSEAIQNARTLYFRQSKLPPAKQNPITTVHKLVERLLS